MAAPKGNQYAKGKKTGVKKAISSPDQLLILFQLYIQYIKSNPILLHDFVGKDADEVQRKKEKPLTMEGFENFVADNGGPLELTQYFINRDGRYEDFATICRVIKRRIRQDQIEGGMAGIYNPSITQRLNGLTDKQEVEHSGIPATETLQPILHIYSSGVPLAGSENEVDERTSI